jgi:hypothetical protein
LVVVRAGQSFETREHVGPAEIADVSVCRGNLAEKKCLRPINANALANEKSIVIVGGDFARFPTGEVKAAVLELDSSNGIRSKE